MTDPAELLQGLTQNYRLGVPAYQAYDPSVMEQMYGTAVARDLPVSANIGMLVGAQGQREAASRQYDQSYRFGADRQYQLGLARTGADRYKARTELVKTALANPNAVAMLSDSRELLAPGWEGHAGERSHADLALTRGKAREAGMHGTLFGQQAGVAPPDGTTYSEYGFPSAAPTQGTPLALRVAQTEAAGRVRAAGSAADGEKTRDVNTYNRDLDNIAQERANAINQARDHAMQMQKPVLDVNGREIQKAPWSPERAAQHIAEVTAAATEQAQMRHQRFTAGMARGGRGHLNLPDNPYSLAPTPRTDSTGNTTVTPGQTPPALGVGGSTGQSRAQTPTPAPDPTRGQPNPTQRLHDTLASEGVDPRATHRRLWNSRPAGTVNVVPGTNGTYTYLDAQNKPLGTISIRPQATQ